MKSCEDTRSSRRLENIKDIHSSSRGIRKASTAGFELKSGTLAVETLDSVDFRFGKRMAASCGMTWPGDLGSFLDAESRVPGNIHSPQDETNRHSPERAEESPF